MLPRAARDLLDRLRVRALPRLTGSDPGGHRSGARAPGLAFAERREYLPGDDARSIDWKAFARTRALTVRTFEEERDARAYVLVDVSRSMSRGEPPKIDAARGLASALGWAATGHGDGVRLVPFAASAAEGSPSYHRRDDHPALEAFLGALGVEGTTSFGEAARGFARRHPRPGPTFVVTDLLSLEDWDPGLRLLAQSGHPATVLRVCCVEDHAPDFDGELDLVDSETGETLSITATKSLREAYRTELSAHVSRVREACVRAGGALLEVDAEQPVDVSVRAVLAPALEHA